MNISHDLGMILKSLRGDMSLREAAKKSGLPRTYIRDLELGRSRLANDRTGHDAPASPKKAARAHSQIGCEQYQHESGVPLRYENVGFCNQCHRARKPLRTKHALLGEGAAI